jgi:hypothetical protein
VGRAEQVRFLPGAPENGSLTSTRASAGSSWLRPGKLRAVSLILADQWMPEGTCVEFLTRARDLHSTARQATSTAVAVFGCR